MIDGRVLMSSAEVLSRLVLLLQDMLMLGALIARPARDVGC